MSELKAVHAFDVYEAYTKTGDDDAAQVYLKSEADEVIAEKDAEIARLKALAKEPSLSNRVCRKCGKEGTLMYMPAVEDNHTFWDIYNNKGIDYVFSIRCAHCGEVAFVTKQAHDYELKTKELKTKAVEKYKRCLAMAKWCFTKSNYHFVLARHGEDAEKNCRKSIRYSKWHRRWFTIADKFNPNSTAQ